MSSKYGVKQGAYGANSIVSTTRVRESVAKDTTRRYTEQFTYTAAHSDKPMSIFVTPKELQLLRVTALRRTIAYVWRMPDGKLEIQ